jgi:RHS repeat-associated protein
MYDGLGQHELFAYKFTGQERDTESGLDNFAARFDSSALGRFMSADPSAGGADEASPQSWNSYAYVGNNPLNAVDPDGLDYYLLGGDQCGKKVQCDDKGHIIDSNGNAVVVTDEQISGSNGLAKIDQNGNLQIKTTEGTFQGDFFDPHPSFITVEPTPEEKALMTLQMAGEMGEAGVKGGVPL